MKSFLISSLILFLLAFNGILQAEEPETEENLYSQLNRAIIRLEHDEVILPEGTKNPIKNTLPDGTGFFINFNNDLYLVTARHVVEKSYDLHARVECVNEKTGQKEVILLQIPRDKWVFHSVGATTDTNYVDVAAMKVNGIRDRSVKSFHYGKEEKESTIRNQLPNKDPEPPKPILVFGFPLDIGFQLLEQRPFGRFGIISMKTEKRFLKVSGEKYAEEKCMVIDARIFPGNSGSPVMGQPGLTEDVNLYGLVIASNNAMDFAIIEPVSRIREVIDVASTKASAGEWKIIQQDSKPNS